MNDTAKRSTGFPWQQIYTMNAISDDETQTWVFEDLSSSDLFYKQEQPVRATGELMCVRHLRKQK